MCWSCDVWWLTSSWILKWRHLQIVGHCFKPFWELFQNMSKSFHIQTFSPSPSWTSSKVLLQLPSRGSLLSCQKNIVLWSDKEKLNQINFPVLKCSQWWNWVRRRLNNELVCKFLTQVTRLANTPLFQFIHKSSLSSIMDEMDPLSYPFIHTKIF